MFIVFYFVTVWRDVEVSGGKWSGLVSLLIPGVETQRTLKSQSLLKHHQ